MSGSSSQFLQLHVTDVAFGGQGVARDGGKVWFIPFTIAGETVRAEALRSKKNFGEATLVAVEKHSADRVTPRCPYFGRCGGCAYQHISYERQLALKEAQVAETLRRVGRLEAPPLRQIIRSPQEYGYRNRIRVHVQDRRAGFFAHRSNSLVEIETCPISSGEVNEALRELRSTPLMDGDYVLSARNRGVYFEQTNDAVARELLAVVTQTVRAQQSALVDAYCGAGFFAHQLAERFSKVVGIEENAHAVEFARREAAPHEQYVIGDVGGSLGPALAELEMATTTVILDPPAAGITPRVSDVLLGAQPSEIVYVSCNPGTLARDLSHLCRFSYRLEAVTPLDMFPQTAEIEVVAHLVRR